MSVTRTVSPYLSPYDRGVLHGSISTRMSTTSTTKTPKLSPTVIPPKISLPQNQNDGMAIECVGGSGKYKNTNNKSTLVNNRAIDPFLSQYIKPSQFRTSLYSHQLYFNSVNKQRKAKLYEIYQKYLVSKNNENNYYKNDNENHVYNKHSAAIYVEKLKYQQQDLKNVPSIINKQTPAEKEASKVEASTPPLKSIRPEQIKQLITPTKPQKQLTKKLPKEFMDCPIDDLINLISRMLHSLVILNDKLVPASISGPDSLPSSSSNTSNNRVLTRYHSRVPPSISTRTYLTRLTKFNNFTPATLLTTIYYIDLLSHHYQPFFTLNSWTVHRFLLVGTMLSQKSMEDFFYTNDHYAKVGGVAISELNCLELDFLSRVDWRCVPAKQLENGKSSIKYSKDVLDLYYSQLIKLMGKNVSKDNEILYVSSQYNYESDEMDDEDDEDDEDTDDYEDGDEDEIEIESPVPYQPEIDEHKYNSMGFSADGSSSPHLKRRYCEG